MVYLVLTCTCRLALKNWLISCLCQNPKNSIPWTIFPFFRFSELFISESRKKFSARLFRAVKEKTYIHKMYKTAAEWAVFCFRDACSVLNLPTFTLYFTFVNFSATWWRFLFVRKKYRNRIYNDFHWTSRTSMSICGVVIIKVVLIGVTMLLGIRVDDCI